jgi:hypothetical protein
MEVQDVLLCRSCGINCDLFKCFDINQHEDGEIIICRECLNSLEDDEDDIDEEDITYLDLLEEE